MGDCTYDGNEYGGDMKNPLNGKGKWASPFFLDYSPAFCRILLYKSGLILKPYSTALSRNGLIWCMMLAFFISKRIPMVPVTWRFMELATILALLSSSITASADISVAKIIASDSPLPKNLERADTAMVFLIYFLMIKPDLILFETSIAPGRPAPFFTTSSNTASGMANFLYKTGR